MNSEAYYVHVSGVDGYKIPEIRNLLRREFSKVGPIKKLYIEKTAKYANVYFNSFEICERAVREFRQNHFGFVVSHGKHKKPPSQSQVETDFPLQTENIVMDRNFSFRENYSEQEISEMDYLEDEFTENHDYCNVHGQPLIVFQADCGDLYVKLKDVKRTGFAIFRRDTYNSILVDKKQIYREFELKLLSEAKSYILANHVNCIDMNTIVQTIEKCKTKLLNGESLSINDNKSLNVSDAQPGHSSSDKNGVGNQEKRNVGYNAHSTASKALSNYFMPSQSHNTNRNHTTKRSSDSNREVDIKDKLNREDYKHVGRGGSKQKNIDSNKRNTHQKDINSITEENRNNSLNLSSSGRKPINQKFDKLKTTSIPNDNVEIGNTYKVQVSCYEKNQDICWVQKEEAVDLSNQLLVEISEIVETANIVTNPVMGQMVLAEFECAWCRAIILDPKTKLVRYIDYGNQCRVNLVRAMPDYLTNVPVYGIGLKINHNPTSLNEGDKLTVIIKGRFDDCTFYAEYVGSSDPQQLHEVVGQSKKKKNNIKDHISFTEDPKRNNKAEKRLQMPKPYFVYPEPISNLRDGDKVMFIDLIGNRFTVKTKECVDKNKELIEYIKELDKSGLVMNNIKEGQLVLCSNESLVGLCRANITEVKQSNVVTVKYVDYPGEDTLTLKSLRNVDDYLSKQPAALLLSPELSYLENLNVAAKNFINEIISRKEKAIVVVSGTEMDFRLENNKLLSEVILETLGVSLTKPNYVEQQPVPEVVIDKKEVCNAKIDVIEAPRKEMSSQSDEITYDDMKWITLEPGEHEVMCFYLKNSKNITLVPADDMCVKHMEDLLQIQDTDKMPHKPDVFEMCLVYYTTPEETEGFWYRGVVIDIENDEYNVLMVDYGNETLTNCNNIRKFPKDLQSIPVLGLFCELIDIKNSPEVTTILKKSIETNGNFKVIIKEFLPDSCKYMVDIPSVRNELKAAGLS